MGRILLWSICFVLLLLVVDQSMMHLPERTDAMGEARQFYLDFRDRLLHREQQGERGVTPLSISFGYVYADAEGDLQFADTLEEVPKRFRAEARPMER